MCPPTLMSGGGGGGERVWFGICPSWGASGDKAAGDCCDSGEILTLMGSGRRLHACARVSCQRERVLLLSFSHLM